MSWLDWVSLALACSAIGISLLGSLMARAARRRYDQAARRLNEATWEFQRETDRLVALSEQGQIIAIPADMWPGRHAGDLAPGDSYQRESYGGPAQE